MLATFRQAFSQTRNSHSRWLIVAASFLLVLTLWSPYTGFGVFLPRLMEEFGWQRGTVALVFSIVIAIGAPVGLLIGKILDRHGPQKVAVFQVVACSASYILASTIQNLWQLYIFLGVILGIGFAGAYIIPTATTARWFQENRGLAVSIVLTGQGLGYFLGPILVVNLIENLGWRGAYLALGVGVAALGILPALVLRNPPPPKVAPAPASTGSGLTPGHSSRETAPPITFQQALSTSTIWLLLFVWVFQAFAQMMFTIHVVPLAVDKGIGLAAAAGALSLYGIGLLSGRIVSGPLSDRLGARIILGVATIIGTVGLAILLITQDLTYLYASSLAFGIAVSGSDTAYIRALPDIVGTKSLGTIMSVMSVGWRLAGGAGPAVAGFLFDATHVYALPFGMSILGLLASIGLFFAASRPDKRL